MLHFTERLLGRPPFLGHAIYRRHDASPVAPSNTVHVNRLVRRITHHLQEGVYDFGCWWLVSSHRDVCVLHPRAFDEALVFGVGVVTSQVDDRLDPDRCKGGVLIVVRLGATVVGRVHACEIVDSDLRQINGCRRANAGRAGIANCGTEEQDARRNGAVCTWMNFRDT